MIRAFASALDWALTAVFLLGYAIALPGIGVMIVANHLSALLREAST